MYTSKIDQNTDLSLWVQENSEKVVELFVQTIQFIPSDDYDEYVEEVIGKSVCVAVACINEAEKVTNGMTFSDEDADLIAALSYAITYFICSVIDSDEDEDDILKDSNTSL